MGQTALDVREVVSDVCCSYGGVVGCSLIVIRFNRTPICLFPQIVLSCIVLYCIVLYCIVLYWMCACMGVTTVFIASLDSSHICLVE